MPNDAKTQFDLTNPSNSINQTPSDDEMKGIEILESDAPIEWRSRRAEKKQKTLNIKIN